MENFNRNLLFIYSLVIWHLPSASKLFWNLVQPRGNISKLFWKNQNFKISTFFDFPEKAKCQNFKTILPFWVLDFSANPQTPLESWDAGGSAPRSPTVKFGGRKMRVLPPKWCGKRSSGTINRDVLFFTKVH